MLGKSDVVLVTGGTGFTGSVLVRRLCGLGCNVRVLARANSDRSGLSGLPIEWIEGNVFDPDVVRRGAEGVHYIFHVAAAYREAKIDDSVYYQVHVESTKLLAKASTLNQDFKRFVHVSTVGVLGHIDNPPANECAPYNPSDKYQETKATAEKWLIEFSLENHLPITIVRPAAIYGPGDRRLLKLFKFAKLPLVPLLGFSKGLYHLIHVEDLTEFLIISADHDRTLGNIYICGNPETTSIRKIVAIVALYLGKKPLFVRVPASPFFLLGYLLEIICRPLNIEPPIYRRRIAFFTKDRAFDTSKMREDTDFSYKYNNVDGVKATAKWYEEQHWL